MRISVITDGAVRLEYTRWEFHGRQLVHRHQQKLPGRNTPSRTRVKGDGRHSPLHPLIPQRHRQIHRRQSQHHLAKGKNVVAFGWKPGIKDAQDLKGTYRTLDGYNGNLFERQDADADRRRTALEERMDADRRLQGYIFDHSDWPWVASRQRGQNSRLVLHGLRPRLQEGTQRLYRILGQSAVASPLRLRILVVALLGIFRQ